MFGYVRIFPAQLKLGEIESYHKVYCGLCHQLAHYSEFSRMFLSFDMVFLTILSCYRDEAVAQACTRRQCMKNIACPDVKIDYWAAISTQMIYQKLLNDVQDGESGKRLYLRALQSGYDRAIAAYESAGKRITGSLNRIYQMEKDQLADPLPIITEFGSLAGSLMELCPEMDPSDAMSEMACRISRFIGEWIYCMDFYDDIEKDRKKSAYNPLLLQMEQQQKSAEEVRAAFRPVIEERIDSLNQCCAFLPYGGFHQIICNVLHEGVRAVTQDVYGRRFMDKKYRKKGEMIADVGD